MSHYGSMLVKCLITVYAGIFFMMAHDGICIIMILYLPLSITMVISLIMVVWK